MNFNISVQTHARFKAIVGKNGKTTKETDWFNNEVLDTGLARMSVGTWIDRCCVGTGNSTPLPTQVALDNFVASTTTKQGDDITGIQVSIEPFYLWARRTWRFAEGVATGNLSEVGLGWGNANLWNRALMRDINGDQTTITVLSDEYLDIVSEVRVYPQRTVSGSFDLLDKNNEVISMHSYVGYPVLTNPVFLANKAQIQSSIANNQYYSSVHNGTITSSPTLADDPLILNGAMEMLTPADYTATSCEQKFTLIPNRNNYEHKAFLIRTGGLLGSLGAWGYKFQITPSITKNNEQRMTYTFKLSWGRYVA